GAAQTLTLAGVATSSLKLVGTITDGTTPGGSLAILSGNNVISGSNAYTGVTTLGGGALVIAGNSNPISSNTLFVTGGQLQADASPRTLTNNVTLLGTLTLSGATS